LQIHKPVSGIFVQSRSHENLTPHSSPDHFSSVHS